MKFCPYCGASLAGSAVSFCSECGKPLPVPKGAAPQPHPPVRKANPPAARRKKRLPPQKQRFQRRGQAPQKPKRQKDETYDGYYEDICPVDAGQQSDTMDPELVKRIVLLVSGAVGIIILAMVLMSLL